MKHFRECSFVTLARLFCKIDKAKKNVQNKDFKRNGSVDLEILEELHNSCLNNSKIQMCEDEQGVRKICCTNNENYLSNVTLITAKFFWNATVTSVT